ncbi:MAG: hypothetical protein ACYS8I_07975 [Planctomycetota bacterium]|jgi:hypothetical protein
MAEEMEQTQDTPVREDGSGNDEPKPVKGKFRRFLRLGCSIAVGGGIVAFFLGPVCRPTMGAPRSAQLRFEQRKAEVERAVLEEQKASDTCSRSQTAEDE